MKLQIKWNLEGRNNLNKLKCSPFKNKLNQYFCSLNDGMLKFEII